VKESLPGRSEFEEVNDLLERKIGGIIASMNLK
jgi:hypothetical protein